MLRAKRTVEAVRTPIGSVLRRTVVASAAAAACAGAVCLSGCGGMYYAVEMGSASSRVEEARVLGAETSAPYEYYYAREHLIQAELEAAEASYSDAAHYAETAEEYAAKAVDVARAARRSASTP
jgi:Domain of unknown function (DUF4398)